MRCVSRNRRPSLAVIPVVLALTIAWISSGGLAVAQTNADSQQLAEDLRVWSTTPGALSAGTSLVIFSPPLAIAPDLRDADWAVQGRATLLLADGIPSPQSAYQNSGQTTYGVYKLLLDNRAPEPAALTRDERRRLRSAENVLLKHRCWLAFWLWGRPEERTPSKHLVRYQEYARQAASLEVAISGTTDAGIRAQLDEQLRKTEAEWTTRGHKAEIDHALADFYDVVSHTPQAFWAGAFDQFRINQRDANGLELPLTTFSPAPADWLREEAWTAWASGNSVGSLKKVAIQRPWLNIDVITTRAWSWADGRFKHESVLISDGTGFHSPDPARELMPLLPVQLLLGKSLRVGAGSTSSEAVILGLICLVVPRQPAQ